MTQQKIVLTGDRPTGKLHLGHYVGSLAARVKLQHTHRQFVMLADTQALTDNADDPGKVRAAILEVALDYLAVGIDPAKTVIFHPIPGSGAFRTYHVLFQSRDMESPQAQSHGKSRRSSRRDTAKTSPRDSWSIPISQAADITAFKADFVPVGDDQIPMIEQTVEIVRKFNRTYNCAVLVEPQAIDFLDCAPTWNRWKSQDEQEPWKRHLSVRLCR